MAEDRSGSGSLIVVNTVLLEDTGASLQHFRSLDEYSDAFRIVVFSHMDVPPEAIRAAPDAKHQVRAANEELQTIVDARIAGHEAEMEARVQDFIREERRKHALFVEQCHLAKNGLLKAVFAHLAAGGDPPKAGDDGKDNSSEATGDDSSFDHIVTRQQAASSTVSSLAPIEEDEDEEEKAARDAVVRDDAEGDLDDPLAEHAASPRFSRDGGTRDSTDSIGPDVAPSKPKRHDVKNEWRLMAEGAGVDLPEGVAFGARDRRTTEDEDGPDDGDADHVSIPYSDDEEEEAGSMLMGTSLPMAIPMMGGRRDNPLLDDEDDVPFGRSFQVPAKTRHHFI